MDFFGLSPINILVIMAVMLIVFGPDRLPEMAAKAGKMIRDLRAYADDAKKEFSPELDELRSHFDTLQSEVRSFGQDLAASSAEIGATMQDATAGLNQHPASTVSTFNEPPPMPAPSEKIVPLPGHSARIRVEDYKPGS